MTASARVPLLAAATFLAGFGVAEITGVRAIGGIVLVAGGYLCWREAAPVAGPRPAALLLAVAFVLFVVSHVLGHAIGAWPAVLVVSALVAAVAVGVLRQSPAG